MTVHARTKKGGSVDTGPLERDVVHALVLVHRAHKWCLLDDRACETEQPREKGRKKKTVVGGEGGQGLGDGESQKRLGKRSEKCEV